ncbi:right-handed parallel beta-helix repeat-containing protein [Streptococcus entericus]|uniref:right-handed parallel beta-helix repeat-containing protein n=1 Tax=Streptococcus entericus TaxID=155680 RepID=UPI000362F8A9|nr:right-handed parallel beta-helix repeat-containing protein [Streptococcus entericus]
MDRTFSLRKFGKNLVAVAIAGLLFGVMNHVSADTWVANSPEQIYIGFGDTSYTLKPGDTLWAIAQRLNLTVDFLAEVNGINLSLGEERYLPVGRVISWDVSDQEKMYLDKVVNPVTYTHENIKTELADLYEFSYIPVIFEESTLDPSGEEDARSFLSLSQKPISENLSDSEFSQELLVNILDFGAKGDGVTDDIDAFYRALDFLKSSSQTKTLFIPKTQHFYRVTSQIEVNKELSGLNILSDGALIRLTQKAPRGHLLGFLSSSDKEGIDYEDESDWVSDITVQGLKLDVAFKSDDWHDNALGVAKGKNILFKDIEILSTPLAGVTIQHFGKNITMDNVHVRHAKNGLTITYGDITNVLVKNSTFNNNAQSGIIIETKNDGYYSVNNITLDNVEASSNVTSGMLLKNASDIIVSNFSSNDNGEFGIHAQGVKDVTFKESEVTDNGLAGIAIVGGSENIIENSLVINNSKEDANKRGNLFINGNGVTVNSVDASEGVRSVTDWSKDNPTVYYDNNFEGTENPVSSDISISEQANTDLSYKDNEVGYKNN